jgi:hypothetical protein
MSNKLRKGSYEEIFMLFSNKIEKWILKIIAGLIILLILSQGALQIPQFRFVLSKIEKMEGTPYSITEFRLKDDLTEI